MPFSYRDSLKTFFCLKLLIFFIEIILSSPWHILCKNVIENSQGQCLNSWINKKGIKYVLSIGNHTINIYSNHLLFLGNSITVAAVTSPSLHNLQLAPAPQIVQKPGSGPHGAPVFGGATAVRTVTPAQNIPTSGNPSFQRLKVRFLIF